MLDTVTRGDTSPEAVRARIAEFCEWFGVEPVKLKVRKGAIYFTDELMNWLQVSGASLDWIYAGEVKGMAATFREKYARTHDQQSFLRTIAKFSAEDQGVILECLTAYNQGHMSFDEALAEMRRRIGAGPA